MKVRSVLELKFLNVMKRRGRNFSNAKKTESGFCEISSQDLST